jgi:uncharacterized protein YukE
MSMLGAQLEDLSGLSTQLTSTSSEITAVDAAATSSTTQVVDGVRQASNAAKLAIDAHMQTLRETIMNANSRLTATQWTGQNQMTFTSAYEQFNSAMVTAENAAKDTFASFERSITTMSTELEEFVTRFNASMADASASTTSMASAVDAQRDNLDQVMNTGMSVG